MQDKFLDLFILSASNSSKRHEWRDHQTNLLEEKEQKIENERFDTKPCYYVAVTIPSYISMIYYTSVAHAK